MAIWQDPVADYRLQIQIDDDVAAEQLGKLAKWLSRHSIGILYVESQGPVVKIKEVYHVHPLNNRISDSKKQDLGEANKEAGTVIFGWCSFCPEDTPPEEEISDIWDDLSRIDKNLSKECVYIAVRNRDEYEVFVLRPDKKPLPLALKKTTDEEIVILEEGEEIDEEVEVELHGADPAVVEEEEDLEVEVGKVKYKEPIPREPPKNIKHHKKNAIRKDMLIFFHQKAYEQVMKHSVSSRNDRGVLNEVGGVLVGWYCHKPDDSNKLFVEVTDAIEAPTSEASPRHVTFSTDAWTEMNSKVESPPYSDESKIIVGWYHTHPGLGVFLSHPNDQFINESHFKQDWQIGLVVDPIQYQGSFFQWRQKSETEQKVEKCGFYEVIESGDEVIDWKPEEEAIIEITDKDIGEEEGGEEQSPKKRKLLSKKNIFFYAVVILIISLLIIYIVSSCKEVLQQHSANEQPQEAVMQRNDVKARKIIGKRNILLAEDFTRPSQLRMGPNNIPYLLEDKKLIQHYIAQKWKLFHSGRVEIKNFAISPNGKLYLLIGKPNTFVISVPKDNEKIILDNQKKLKKPRSLAVLERELYLLDNSGIHRYTKTNVTAQKYKHKKLVYPIGTTKEDNAGNEIKDFVVGKDGGLYVVYKNRVLKVIGGRDTDIPSKEEDFQAWDNPTSIQLAQDGSVYVADAGPFKQGRIVHLSPTGKLVKEFLMQEFGEIESFALSDGTIFAVSNEHLYYITVK